MGTAIYRITKSDGGWHVKHEGKAIGPYATKEIALETAFAAARRAARAGHAISISAPESEPEPNVVTEAGPVTLERS